MSNTVSPISKVAFVSGQAASPPVQAVQEIQPIKGVHGQAADLRLVIEEDEATGAFVYKTLDRRTGEVVQQLPREDVLRLKSSDEYEPGRVVDTRD